MRGTVYVYLHVSFERTDNEGFPESGSEEAVYNGIG